MLPLPLLRVFFLCMVLIVVGCGRDAATDQAQNADQPIAPPTTPTAKTILESNIEYLRLRDQPGTQGEILENLPRGASMEYLGEMSSFRTEVSLRGITFNEPWIKVRTESGTEGWVFAGALNFRLDNSSALPEQLMDIRLGSIFGTELAEEMKAYRTGYTAAKTDDDLHRAYQQADSLRDRAVKVMESTIVVADTEKLPDLFWLEEALPALQPQLVAEGTQYYLFHDFREWAARAARTSGRADDAFFDLSQALFSVDSIEYFFPAYFLQTWDYGGHSELGAGKHEELLRRMDRAVMGDPLFAGSIMAYKEALLADILGPDLSYWNEQAAILEELDRILADPPSILSREDQIALEQRRQQFEDPEEHGIQLNQRSGQ